MQKDINDIYSFITFTEQLKNIERFKGQFYWKDYPKRKRYESVAEHTWRLSMLVISFENRLSQIVDIKKMLKMALIHDLPEIVAGDDSPMGKDGKGIKTHAFNEKAAEKRHSREEIAAKFLFDKLPKKEAAELFKLWEEYEEQDCFEAKVVKSLDKIECMLQVLEYRKGNMFKDHLDFTIKYGMKGSEVDPAVKEFGQLIANKLKNKFVEFKMLGK